MAKKTTDTVTETVEQTEQPSNMRASGIIVHDPNDFRPKSLPLVVILPPGANKAQVERAKVLNGYAYQFSDKWAVEKEKHLKDLEALADVPDMPENPNAPKLYVGTALPKEIN